MRLCVFCGKLPKTVRKTLKITAGKLKHNDILRLTIVPKKPPDVSHLNEIANDSTFVKESDSRMSTVS